MVSLALFGIRNYWDMDEEVVVKILKKARLLPQQEREFMLNVLAERMLAIGIPDEQICNVLRLNSKKLAAIKKALKD